MPTIVTRAQWGARSPRSRATITSWTRRVGVAVHHSATGTDATVRGIQDHQMDANGWSDIGYNWLVTQDGRVWEGRAGGWLAVGAHAGGQNTGWIGVCWIGDSRTIAPSAAALASIRWLIDEARRRAGRRLEVRGHGQVPGQATQCPGDRLRAWIAAGLPVVEEEDDVSWSERIKRRPWVTQTWPHLGETARADTTVAAIYGFSRLAAERAEKLAAGQEAILAAVAGRDVVAAVEAKLAEHKAEWEERLDAAEAEREEIARLIRQVESGERDAAAVVDEIGRRLHGGETQP